MVNVIGVRFENAGKLYFFDPDTMWPTPGSFVLVETTRGIELGEVVTSVKEMDETQLNEPLKKVVKIADAQDIEHAKENKKAEKEAYAICQQKIAEHKLDMKLVSVEYTFDNSKILFYFTANGRIDFRVLVKDLASVFKTRIELRQIGVRDEAKILGGLAPCGRPICCRTFLGDFQPVSIKMAKEQNLSLNPTKISGVCGRLMCCLKYEEDNYEETRKRMPKVGREVVTPDGVGVVWDLNIIKETVRVRLQKGDSSEMKDFKLEEIQQNRTAQVHQNETRESENNEQQPVDQVITVQSSREENTEGNVHKEKKQYERKPKEHTERKPAAEAKSDTKAVNDKNEEKQTESKEKAVAQKPKTSPWKMAVENALKATKNEQTGD